MPVRIQPHAFDAGAELASLTHGRGDIGASVTFVGQMREFSGAMRLDAMTLEHYPAMAQAELERIEALARARFAVCDLEIVHRYGEMHPGDPIVLVIATAPARQPAFDAAGFVMDHIKTSAPFWKKERGAQGEACVDARETDAAAAARWPTGTGS